MLKKILIALIVLGVIAVALFGFGIYKVTDEAIKEKEPILRQYLQMTVDEQNNYILTHADDIIKDAVANANPDEKVDAELLEKTKNDPVVQKALVDLERSIMAKMIMHSDSIVKDMDAATKAGYQKESDEFTNRMEKYSDVLDSAKTAAQTAK